MSDFFKNNEKNIFNINITLVVNDVSDNSEESINGDSSLEEGRESSNGMLVQDLSAQMLDLLSINYKFLYLMYQYNDIWEALNIDSGKIRIKQEISELVEKKNYNGLLDLSHELQLKKQYLLILREYVNPEYWETFNTNNNLNFNIAILQGILVSIISFLPVQFKPETIEQSMNFIVEAVTKTESLELERSYQVLEEYTTLIDGLFDSCTTGIFENI